MLLDPQGLIDDFVQVARLSGFDIEAGDIVHEALPAPHRPPALPKGKQAVYVFSLAACGGKVLKVGKAGPKSGPRFRYQHYNPNSAPSTLAAVLASAPETWPMLDIVALDDATVGEWLMVHTSRDHFFLDASQSAGLSGGWRCSCDGCCGHCLGDSGTGMVRQCLNVISRR